VRCRHTVPDWHRFVGPGEGHAAIFAACRLLVREGEAAQDARAIACAYWGRQEECPMYEGPRRQSGLAGTPADRESGDVPIVVATAWPVRTPGERDPFAAVLIGLAIASVLLLATALGLALAAPVRLTGAHGLLVGALALSILAHGLTLLKAWAAR